MPNAIAGKCAGFMNKAAFFLFIFIAVSILLSLWLGYFWRNSIFIFIVSIALSYLIYRKFYFNFLLKPGIFLLSALMFVLCIYPVFLITPYYSASIDSAQIIITRSLAEKIPITLAPYSDIVLGYYVAYHSFVKLFADLFPIIGDYLWYAFIGAFVSALELIAIYLFSREFLKSELAGEIAAILFFSTRIVFQNFYWGMHPMILGMSFALLAAYMHLKRNNLRYLFFPTALAAHAGAVINATVLIAALLIHESRKALARRFAPFASSALLAIPAFAVPYAIYILNALSASKGQGIATLQMLFYVLGFVPLWIGVVSSIAFAIGLLLILHNRKKFFSPKEKFLLKLFVFSIILYSIAALGIVLKDTQSKLISLATIAAIIFIASVFSKLRVANSRTFRIALLIICLASFFSSSLIIELQKGEAKIGNSGYQFATAFREFDPSLQKTLFLTKDSLAEAMYSNKIPFDVYAYFPRDIYLPYGPWQTLHNKAWRLLFINKMKQDYIIEEKCIECIYDLAREQNIKYIAIEKGFFGAELAQKAVFSYGDFMVYDVMQK